MANTAERPQPLPQPTPETQHFWDGTKLGELRLQRCTNCGHVYFPPRPLCPECNSCEIEVFAASGRGKLASYVANHCQQPSFDSPYAIAIVQLDEGPMLTSNIVGCEQTPEALLPDMPLTVTFEDHGEVAVPLFRPALSKT